MAAFHTVAPTAKMSHDRRDVKSSAVRQATSPEPLPGNERKRRRKVLSCYDCRRRKLQCDRNMPACGRCTKAGQAASCLYLDEASDGPRPDPDGKGPFDGHISRPIQQTAAPVGNALSRLEYQERRIRQLEAALAQTGHPQTLDSTQRLKASRLPLTPESMMVAAEQIGTTINDRETMLLRGKGFKTQFHGTTHPAALIAHIPELNIWTKETLEKYPALAKIRHDMHTLEDRTDYAGCGLKSHSTPGVDLKALLPSQAEADSLIQIYLDNYGSIYHILHLPTFWKEYREMWSDIQAARPHFVAIVLLICAAAQCLTSTQPWLYVANSSAAREKAITYIQACEDWLLTQSQKHVTAADFQIRFLLLFGKQVSARKYKRSWTDSGTLLRFCMSAGLHRNPDLIRKPTSALDKELRRRIWAVVTEIELQSSFDRGMIASQWPLQADCPPPSNIHDESLDQETDQLPMALRGSEFTRSSYLSTSSESTLLRHGLNTTLNNIRQTISFDDVKRFTEEIEAQLQAIPQWTVDQSNAPRALLTLNLYQYLLALHDRQFRQAETTTERNFSRMILINTATKIIDTHRALVNNGCMALELLCHDQLRAALSICHVATTSDLKADSAIGQVIEHHANRIMDEAVQMLTDKVIRFGREQRQLWVALAAHGLWKSTKDPNQRSNVMQEAVDKITRPYYKIMACQEDGPVVLPFVGGTVPASRDGEMPNSITEYMPPVSAGKMGGLEGVPEQILDLDEIEAWTFDNWGFDPAQVQIQMQQSFGNSCAPGS